MPRYRYKPKCGKYFVKKDGKYVALVPGEIIDCPESALGPHANRFEFVQDDVKPPLAALELKSRGHGRWDVVNPKTGLAINDKALSRAEAEALAGQAASATTDEPPAGEPDGQAAEGDPSTQEVEPE